MSEPKTEGPSEPRPGLLRKAVEVAGRLLHQLLELIAPSPDGPSATEIRSITKQFFLTLRAAFLRVPEPPAGEQPARRIWERASEIVKRGETAPSWDDNYQIEQYLADLHAAEALRAEIAVRSIEAARVLRPELAAWYAGERERIEKSDDLQAVEPHLRALLGRLVNDLQWRYKIRESVRGYKQQISRDAAIAFVVALGAFGLVLFFGLDPDGSEGHSPEGGTDQRGLAGALSLAAVTGAFGASFSMLINSSKRLANGSLDDLKLLASRWVLLSRVLVGCGAAVVLLFFLYGGLLAGSAFPELAGEAARELELRGLALLVFWCFLSGFSETLVPALLSRMERKASGDEPPGSRPSPDPNGRAASEPVS